MRIQSKPLVAALCFLGLASTPVFAVVDNTQQIEKISSRTQTLETELSQLRKEVKILKRGKVRPVHKKVTYKARARQTAQRASDTSRSELVKLIKEERNYLPFDIDVPGQSFVSTGPYVGVPIQYDGSTLIINSPSVNTDVQLLGIRKEITDQLKAMGGIINEPYHTHLLLSGVIEGDVSYLNNSSGPDTTDIDLSNMTIDALALGPTNWTLGFVELTYDNSPPSGNSTGAYRVSNSRVFVNKAFVTLGDFSKTPFYGTFGQFYVPFGRYSSVMTSDPLTKLLTRTKARAILLGYQQQADDALYGAVYVFSGDSHTTTSPRVINNGGINLGYKFKHGKVHSDIGAGVIANIADSAGMQLGNGFGLAAGSEKIAHRVPGYNLRGILGLGEHWNFIAEYVTAARRFSATDMSYNGRGAQPWAVDTELAYSFYILDEKPSTVGVGYSKSQDALSVGLPLQRYLLIFTTSLLRNTLESFELRRDLEYPASSTATGSGTIGAVTSGNSGRADNAVTASFDYYF